MEHVSRAIAEPSSEQRGGCTPVTGKQKQDDVKVLCLSNGNIGRKDLYFQPSHPPCLLPSQYLVEARIRPSYVSIPRHTWDVWYGGRQKQELGKGVTIVLHKIGPATREQVGFPNSSRSHVPAIADPIRAPKPEGGEVARALATKVCGETGKGVSS